MEKRRSWRRLSFPSAAAAVLVVALLLALGSPFALAKKGSSKDSSVAPKSFLSTPSRDSAEMEQLAATAAAAAAAANALPKAAGNLVTTRDGKPFFMLGVNLGNVKFLPFSKATQYTHTPAELQAILEGALRDIAAAGGNTVRFWLHIDGSSSPEWDPATGLASGVSPETLRDLKWFLQRARDYKLEVILSLWSHDILAVRRCNPPATRDRALRIWEDPAATDAYIQRALLPMLADLGASRMADGRSFLQGGVFSWEIANEPEEACEELEFNTNYQYKLARGEYSYSNPGTFNSDPRRKSDYQDIAFMQRDMQRVDSSDSSQVREREEEEDFFFFRRERRKQNSTFSSLCSSSPIQKKRNQPSPTNNNTRPSTTATTSSRPGRARTFSTGTSTTTSLASSTRTTTTCSTRLKTAA